MIKCPYCGWDHVGYSPDKSGDYVCEKCFDVFWIEVEFRAGVYSEFIYKTKAIKQNNLTQNN